VGTFSERLDALLALDHGYVGEKGRTIARVHGSRRPRAVVLLHGLSSSPAQFGRFAEELFGRGHNVVVPRLPRHGHADRLSRAQARLTGEELLAASREVVEIGRELGEHVTVAGFSLGGLMAAWIAQHYEIDRAVAIAPFFGVALFPNRTMTLLSELLLRIPNRFPWWHPIKRERLQPEHGYPRYSTHALAHAILIARSLLAEAAEAPPLAHRIVLVHNASESAVNNRAIRRLHAIWSGRRPGAVDILELRGLPPSHDIVEPLQRSALADRVYPALLEAIDPCDSKEAALRSYEGE